MDWRVTNTGNRASGTWTDRVVLSHDGVAVDAVLATVVRNGPLEANATYDAFADVTLPLGTSGNYFIVVVSNYTGSLSERSTSNNSGNFASAVALSPYADLAVSNVTAPPQTIDDPARINVSWTVTNQGTGVGRTTQWTDCVVLSGNDVYGDGDDLIIGSFVHNGALAATGSYTRTESILLPNGLSNRFHVFVKSDVLSEVFENGSESNNTASLGSTINVMPIPYADLVVESLAYTGTPRSGQSLGVTWTIENQGIGTTNVDYWNDHVYLSTNPAGGSVAYELGSYTHIGRINAGLSYDRAIDVVLPNGISGTFYLVVDTGGPYEFIHGTAATNRRVLGPLTVQLSDTPDLMVTNIVAPTSALESDFIDISWTVLNNGLAHASGTWTDTIALKRLDDPNAPLITLGETTYDRGLAPGITYTRTERFQLPAKKAGIYAVVITTNKGSPRVYEHGTAAGNNSTLDDTALTVGLKDRPDLQVLSATVPERVSAGGTASVNFTIINQGNAAANGQWKDYVYLSLDAQFSADDILVGNLSNGSALEPEQVYSTISGTFTIPIRFRGDAYIIVMPDAQNKIDEYPNDNNNIRTAHFYVDPVPLSDLVTSNVVAPAQAVHGAQVEVRYTVTNKGSATTDVGTWQDTIWLTKDKTRPNPGKGDIKLGTFTHDGGLGRQRRRRPHRQRHAPGRPRFRHVLHHGVVGFIRCGV